MDSPVKETTETSSFVGLITDSTNDIAAAFSSGRVRSCEALVSIRMARLRGRSILSREFDDLLRLAVFEQADVFLFQARKQPAVAVLRGKKNVYHLGIDLDYFVFIGRWCRGRSGDFRPGLGGICWALE